MANLHYWTGKVRRQATANGHALGKWNRYAPGELYRAVTRDALCTHCHEIASVCVSDLGVEVRGRVPLGKCKGYAQ